MAITVRLTFDLEVADLDDTDDLAHQVAKTCAPAVRAALPDQRVKVVSVSRLVHVATTIRPGVGSSIKPEDGSS